MKFYINLIFKKDLKYFFLGNVKVDVKGVKTNLKVGGAEDILSNISEIIEDTSFCVNRQFTRKPYTTIYTKQYTIYTKKETHSFCEISL